MEKEAEGFVFEDPESELPKSSRWSAVCKACTRRPVNKTGLERAMTRAWGLHREAQFRDMGSNIFVVHFGSEGDYKHVMNNGPWQFDFSVLIMKEYEGKTRPPEMVFNKVDMWVKVVDLPPDKRTAVFGKALGNWIGEVVKVDMDKDGIARGNQLRVRAKIDVYEPLVRGFHLKKSKEEKVGTWFDFYYEKIPHFRFDCGRLVHKSGFCEPPVDSSSQWGGWLRASPGRNTSKDTSAGGAASSSDSRNQSVHEEGGRPRNKDDHVRVRDLPTKRNLSSQFSQSAENRTGGQSKHRDGEFNSPRRDSMRGAGGREYDLREGLERRRERDLREKLFESSQERDRRFARDIPWERKGKDAVQATPGGRYNQNYEKDEVQEGHRVQGQFRRRRGYYVRKPRQNHDYDLHEGQRDRTNYDSRKRGPRQVWVAKGDGERVDGPDAFIRDTQRKTSTVFERISENVDKVADPEGRGHREQ